MKTTFRENQKITASPVIHLQIGCIYVFIYNDELTIHRLMNIGEHSLKFKGDMSLCYETIPANSVLGFVPSRYNFIYLFLSPYNQLNQPKFIRFLSRFLMIQFSKIFPQPNKIIL
ncbi:MAG: hypothetical protein K2P81_06175 [Bacteriovoracaceae bacterium]|nr:hypothetical protein [Bacteriovoracaceae bacterium]